MEIIVVIALVYCYMSYYCCCSGAVAISAMMSVDAFITKGGMKMVSTLHTSTAIRGKLELSNNKDFTLELDFPRHKSEVINME